MSRGASLGKSVGVAVITHTAAHHLPHCLPPLLNSAMRPRVLVVNSSSEDGTLELAQQMGAETLRVPRASFNHGATRELARRHLATDIIVMMTPDAYAVGEGEGEGEGGDLLETLTAPLFAEKASVAYARQLPHVDADLFAAFAREYNYPATGHIRSLEELARYGIYTFFCSNSCAAYTWEALEQVGGFPSVLSGEDSAVLARLLQRGHSVAYVAEARVYHSHNGTLGQEFARAFDTGLARSEYAQELFLGVGDLGRGRAYARALLQKVFSERPALLPYALLHLTARFAGYTLGRYSGPLPRCWKRLFSAQEYYWQNLS